jgi:hypothetical protein
MATTWTEIRCWDCGGHGQRSSYAADGGDFLGATECPRKRPHGRVAGALAVRDRTAGDGQLWHAPVTAAATQNFRNALTRGAATSTIRC